LALMLIKKKTFSISNFYRTKNLPRSLKKHPVETTPASAVAAKNIKNVVAFNNLPGHLCDLVTSPTLTALEYKKLE